MVLLCKKVNVSGGDDAHQLATHGACLRDGDAREAMPDLGFQHVAHGVRGAQHHGVRDKALFKFLWAETEGGKGWEIAGGGGQPGHRWAEGALAVPQRGEGPVGNEGWALGPHVEKGRQDPTAIS